MWVQFRPKVPTGELRPVARVRFSGAPFYGKTLIGCPQDSPKILIEIDFNNIVLIVFCINLQRNTGMSNLFMTTAVKTWFALTSRDRASRQIRKSLAKYLALTRMVNAETGALPVLVPRMIGIDEDMRNWSFFMILEHNAIVNRSITSIVQSLVRGEEPKGAGAIDPKKDVMPSADPGEEQIKAFRSSVEEHLRVVSGVSGLRGSLGKRHPMFGEFDAHCWHCMFSFHLLIHCRQAEYVVRKICAEQGSGADKVAARSSE